MTLSAQETEARKALDAGTLEFPRMFCKADGTQVRVESRQDAKAALEAGLTLLPTAADPHDGGTPNVPPKTVLPQAIQDAIASTVDEALSKPTPPVEADEDDAPPKRKR